MQKFTVSVFINRSQQDVFDFLSNPANLSKWDSDFESANWISSDAPGIGSIYRASGKRLGSEREGLFEIVHWNRPDYYSFKVKERMFLFERADRGLLSLLCRPPHERPPGKCRMGIETGWS